MASISTDKTSGRRTLQFTDEYGVRITVRLGKVTARDADRILLKVESILSAKMSRRPLDAETAEWVGGLPDMLAKKLAAVGLIEERSSSTLAGFFDSYLESRTDLKRQSIISYQQTRRSLVDYFGEGKQLREITPGEGDRWRLWLREQGLADNTIRKRCGVAKQILKQAVRHKFIPENPFVDLESAVRGNRERFKYVTREEIAAVISACPDADGGSWWHLLALPGCGLLKNPCL